MFRNFSVNPPRAVWGRSTRAAALALGSASAIAAARVEAQSSAAYEPRGAAELAQLVDGLGMTARVLVIGAHPDDEDTRLIAYLARGRHAETAYLALTRGDGGQNLIGNELGEALGAIRTEELLAARRIDGGRQYFTRAYDFGFSKTAEETFRHWPRDTVLGDVVRVVRAFRPHVVIAIFSGTPADGHGHHQASGILAREAYDAAADTVRFPTREFGPAWSVGKFYRNTSYRGGEGATLRYNAGRYDPVLGRSYAELASISRSQHKSQGQGALEPRGVSIVSMRREATRVNAGTAPTAERDLFDGIDTTVARLRPAVPAVVTDSLAEAIGAVEAAADLRQPDRDATPLARGLRLTQVFLASVDLERRANANEPTPARLDAQATAETLTDRMSRALQLALGVTVEATVPRATIVGGEAVPLAVRVFNRGVRTLRVRLNVAEGPSTGSSFVPVAPDSSVLLTTPWPTQSAAAAELTTPFWLRSGRRGDLFGVAPAGRPLAPDVDWCCVPEGIARVQRVGLQLGTTNGDATIPLSVPVDVRIADPVRGEVDRPVAVVPAISVTLDRAVQYARANTALDRVVTVHLRSASTTARTATVRLALPGGLTADSATRTVTLAGYDARVAIDFHVRGTLRPGRTVIRASAESNGERFATGYQLLDYDHIRPQRLYRPAETAIEAVDVALPPRAAIAYVPGVGDNVAPMLADLGMSVTVLDSTALGTGDLSKFTHVVVGPRAYDANPALAGNNARLMAWVQRGGTMVVQYGQNEMTRPGVMPYPITLGRPAQRVTIEEAPVTVLDPTAGVLTTPNRIGAADWTGWVQERSTYMPQTADPRYHTVLAMNDLGEAPNANGVLVAPVGRGTYVYVTLALFRQLPAGVPGAARLMANLLAAHGAAGTAFVP